MTQHQHHQPHGHVHDQSFWDDMYRNRTAAWDPDPNPFLPEDLAGLKPGKALDVGCGEGSDAVWLAKQGWDVTAVDLSDVALDRGRAADTGQQVTWQQADILKWAPPADTFDLVTSHFLHFPPAERARLFGDLARAVRPGGTMLIVSHHVSDLQTTIGRPPMPELFFEADEIAATLPAGQWEVLVGGTRPRETHDREGRKVTIHDMVFKARRRG
jgi:SAM-dependent methyltransferase